MIKGESRFSKGWFNSARMHSPPSGTGATGILDRELIYPVVLRGYVEHPFTTSRNGCGLKYLSSRILNCFSTRKVLSPGFSCVKVGRGRGVATERSKVKWIIA